MIVAPAPTLSPPRSPRRRRSRLAGPGVNPMYVPALLLFGVFTVYPLFSGIAISFTDWDGYNPERSNVGVANYVRLLGDESFRLVLGNTFVYGIGSTVIQQLLGLGLALALDRRMRGRTIARAVIYLPVLVSPVVMGTFYYLLFQYNNGSLNEIAVTLGGERVAWLSEAGSAVTIIVLVNSIQFVGISMVIYLAGLQGIAPEYIDAARIDGASSWQQLRHVVLPLLQPAFATSIILNLIGGLKLFDVIQVLSGGGPGISTNSVSTYIGRTYFDNQAAGYSAAMGVVLFLIIVILTLLANALLTRRRLEQQ